MALKMILTVDIFLYRKTILQNKAENIWSDYNILYQIKVRVASNEFKNSSPKYPEKKKELEKLANSLKETDNPVLMMVRLKK